MERVPDPIVAVGRLWPNHAFPHVVYARISSTPGRAFRHAPGFQRGPAKSGAFCRRLGRCASAPGDERWARARAWGYSSYDAMPQPLRAYEGTSGTPSLEVRPKAEARSIEDLVDEARKGRLRVPRFQRGLKWKPEDALLLLDSIYRGYPIGTLLFWQTKAGAEQVSFGPKVTYDADARADAWWVVDGQQRLTSLVRVLLGPVDDEFHLWFDLDDESFVRGARHRTDASRFLPLTEVIDSERLLQWVNEHGLSADRKKVAFRLNKRVREYSVPAYIVETENEEVLRSIFERTNGSGKALTLADVFDALYGGRAAKEPADFEGVANSLADLGFGDVDENILYRALLAIHDLDPTSGEIRASFPNAAEAYKRTAVAMRGAIVFIVGHVGVPHASLLPYKQPLVALAKFFDRHPEPSPRSRELLRRWVWRGAWNGAHRGDTVSTRAILDAVSGDEDGSVQRLLLTIDKKEPKESGVASYNFRTARTKLEVLSLLSLMPKHLVTGSPISPSSVTGPDAIAAIDVAPGITTIAERVVHPRIPKLAAALAHADRTIRESHAVSSEAHAALVEGRAQAFFRLREQTIQELVVSFLRSRAKWKENDRPPLRGLRIPDED